MLAQEARQTDAARLALAQAVAAPVPADEPMGTPAKEKKPEREPKEPTGVSPPTKAARQSQEQPAAAGPASSSQRGAPSASVDGSAAVGSCMEVEKQDRPGGDPDEPPAKSARDTEDPKPRTIMAFGVPTAGPDPGIDDEGEAGDDEQSDDARQRLFQGKLLRVMQVGLPACGPIGGRVAA